MGGGGAALERSAKERPREMRRQGGQASPPADGVTRPQLAIALLLVILTAIAWHRVFTVWFAQDDFRWLLRAAEGVAGGTPRVLSMSLYFRAMLSVFGLHPAAYHAVQLALHAGSGLLLATILARRVPGPLAAAAAAVFLTSPALFTALHWISDIADVLSCFWLLAAAWLLTRPAAAARDGWLAIAAYVLALLSKEIAVGAAPALALLQWRARDSTARARAGLCLALAVAAAVPASGAWQTGTGEPYQLRPLAALLNLPAYVAGATIGFTAWSAASDLTWSRQLAVQIAGWVILAAWLAALLRARSAPAWLGLLWFAGSIGPVAMLDRQFYLYYLTVALPGLLASVAFLVAAATSPRSRYAIVLVLLWVAAQVVAIQARHGSKLSIAPLPTDFVLRRALVASNAISDLERQRDALRPRVVLLGQQPVASSARGWRGDEPDAFHRDPWLDENVRASLADGEAVRLFFPQVREAVFQPWLLDADTASAVAAYQFDGRVHLTSYAAFLGVPHLDAPATREEHAARAQTFLSKRLFVEARRELEAALALAPRDPTLLLNLGVLQAYMGDSLGGMSTLARAVESSPSDVEALFNLGLLQWRLGRTSDARATWTKLLEVAPGSDLARSVRELWSGKAR
jgi:tetratricopeptide (TPR) repeat protein